MKLAPAAVSRFLKQPGAEIRAALFYGPDAGLVRERAEAFARTACPDLADPFRVADLTGPGIAGDPARLADEMATLSLTGGRRVIRLREAADTTAPAVANALAGAGQALLVVEAGELAPRSALRKLFEAAKDAAAVPCYADSPKELAEVIRASLAERHIEISREALAYLVDNLGGDRLVTRSELEKLALYAGDGGRVGIEEAMACVGDTAALSLDDVVYAVADGDAAALERALLRAFQEGQAPISVLRALTRHFHRLHVAAAQVAAGMAPAEAVKTVRPPVFFKLQPRFAAQLRRWPPARIGAALALLTEAEVNAKRTVLPQEAVCRDAFLRLCRAAA